MTGCATPRVVPCRPDESFLLDVIGSGGDVCGRAITTPAGEVRHPSFPDEDVAAFEQWIRNGAI